MAKSSRTAKKPIEPVLPPTIEQKEMSDADLVFATAVGLFRRWKIISPLVALVVLLFGVGYTKVSFAEIASNASFLAAIYFAGVVAVTLALFLSYLIILNQETQATIANTLTNHRRVAESSESLIDHLREEREQAERLTEDIVSLKNELRKNAEFVPDGFIGLQRRAIEIQSIPETDAPLLYAIYGHLPSHIRTDDLDLEVARKLYEGWTPDRLLPDYVDLINKRRKAHADFVAKGGECWEFFSLAALENYAQGRTAFDHIIDAQEERRSRFERLRQLLDEERCNICLFKRPIGNGLLLRTPKPSFPDLQPKASGGALLLDLRLPDSVTNFNESCYGIYSHNSWTVSVYLKKVEALLSAARIDKDVIDSKSSRGEVKGMVNQWIASIDK